MKRWIAVLFFSFSMHAFGSLSLQDASKRLMAIHAKAKGPSTGAAVCGSKFCCLVTLPCLCIPWCIATGKKSHAEEIENSFYEGVGYFANPHKMALTIALINRFGTSGNDAFKEWIKKDIDTWGCNNDANIEHAHKTLTYLNHGFAFPAAAIPDGHPLMATFQATGYAHPREFVNALVTAIQGLTALKAAGRLHAPKDPLSGAGVSKAEFEAATRIEKADMFSVVNKTAAFNTLLQSVLRAIHPEFRFAPEPDPMAELAALVAARRH